MTDESTCDLCGAAENPNAPLLECRVCAAMCCEFCIPAGRGTPCVNCEEE